MSSEDVYDLVVIGSGPAGEKGAAQAAYFGKRVALVEAKPVLGGTCVHWGTIPSKCLRESAQHLSGFKTRGIAGLGCVDSHTGVRVDQLLAHKTRVCEAEMSRIERNLDRHKVDVIEGFARYLDPRTIEVRRADGSVRTLRAAVSLIATGTHPFRPDTMDFDHENIYDSDEILTLDSVPKSLIVVGAGVIGCEYAAMFAALGVQVTLLEPRGAILPFLDEDVRQALQGAFGRMGMTVRLETKVEKAVIGADGLVTAQLGGGETLTAEKLLFAAGRTGNTGGMGLEAIGVKVDKRGLIAVDEHYQTACPGVYAAGDVIGFPALASTSMDQARVAMVHAFDLKYKRAVAKLFPYGIYTIPEVSMVGATVQELKEKGLPYEIGTAYYRDNARGRIMGDAEGMLKLVFEPATRKLLGVHIVGENAAELVHIGLIVLQLGAGIDAFIDTVFNYPTLSEQYKYAAYDGLGRLAKRSASGS